MRACEHFAVSICSIFCSHALHSKYYKEHSVCWVSVKYKGGQTAILVRWSAAQRTTEMLDQRTGKNSGPAPADYQNWASAIPL